MKKGAKKGIKFVGWRRLALFVWGGNWLYLKVKIIDSVGCDYLRNLSMLYFSFLLISWFCSM